MQRIATMSDGSYVHRDRFADPVFGPERPPSPYFLTLFGRPSLLHVHEHRYGHAYTGVPLLHNGLRGVCQLTANGVELQDDAGFMSVVRDASPVGAGLDASDAPTPASCW